MADYAIAKAFKRKVGVDEELLSKIQGKREGVSLLMNPQRRLIFQYICNTPCNHLRAISRALNFSTQTVSWHLKKLKDADLITESSSGKKKLYHPLKNIIAPLECRILALLNNDNKRRLYIYIKRNPEKTQRELCSALKTYQQLLSNNLISLKEYDLINSTKKGKRKVYFITGKIHELYTAFDLKKTTFARVLIAALTEDNLNPKLKRSSANTLFIKLDIADKNQDILKIIRNPFWALHKGQKSR